MFTGADDNFLQPKTSCTTHQPQCHLLDFVPYHLAVLDIVGRSQLSWRLVDIEIMILSTTLLSVQVNVAVLCNLQADWRCVWGRKLYMFGTQEATHSLPVLGA